MGATKQFILEMLGRVEETVTDQLPGRIVNNLTIELDETGCGDNYTINTAHACNLNVNPYTNTYTVANKRFTATFTGDDADQAAANIISWLIKEEE